MLKLKRVGAKLGRELRQVARFYPSSKLCSRYEHKKVKLSLAERIFTCESCGLVIDRDLHAAIHLDQAKEYIVLPNEVIYVYGGLTRNLRLWSVASTVVARSLRDGTR